MFTARTSEDFVRMYDGNDTPIAKVYSRKKADELFISFRIVTVKPHYFPIRFLRLFKTGGIIHKFLDKHCGVLIYYILEKPTE